MFYIIYFPLEVFVILVLFLMQIDELYIFFDDHQVLNQNQTLFHIHKYSACYHFHILYTYSFYL